MKITTDAQGRKTFEFDTAEMPTPIEKFRKLLKNAGASDAWCDHVTPGFKRILQEATAKAYAQGSRDGTSRSRNRPGDGDMGG